MTTLTLTDQAAALVKAGVSLERRLLEISRQEYGQRLAGLEERHGMTTRRFLHRFNTGKLDDRETWFDWLFAHQAYAELSRRLTILRGIRL